MCLQNTIAVSQLNIFHLAHLDILNIILMNLFMHAIACPVKLFIKYVREW